MDVFWTIVAVVAGVFWAAFAEYVGGRILLPEVGLTAPEYWTWFWFSFFVVLFGVPFYAIKAALS